MAHERVKVVESFGLREDVLPNVPNLSYKFRGLLRDLVRFTTFVSYVMQFQFRIEVSVIRTIALFGGSEDERVFRRKPAHQLHLRVIETAGPPPAD